MCNEKSTLDRLLDELGHDPSFVEAARILCQVKHGEPPSPLHDVAYTAGHDRDERCVNHRHLRWSADVSEQLANLFPNE